MLHAEFATLYGVETKVLVQAIKRNIERFSLDFMFQLNADEFANLRSSLSALHLYRAGRGHVFVRVEQPARHR